MGVLCLSERLSRFSGNDIVLAYFGGKESFSRSFPNNIGLRIWTWLLELKLYMMILLHDILESCGCTPLSAVNIYSLCYPLCYAFVFLCILPHEHTQLFTSTPACVHY